MTVNIIQIFTLSVLLALSAFFSGAETALVKVSKIKIKHWIYTSTAHTQAWANWLTNPQELLTTILIGNTLVGVFFSSAMTVFAVGWFQNYGKEWVQTLAGASSFLLILVFGEMVPKIYCIQNTDRVSFQALGPLSTISKILQWPLKKFFRLLGNLLPIFKELPTDRFTSLTLEEIHAILVNSPVVSGLDREHQEMMRKVLSMHQTKVVQIMTPWNQVDFLLLDEIYEGQTKLERFTDRMVESGRTRLPVLRTVHKLGNEPARLAGYICVKDLLAFVARDQKISIPVLLRLVRPLPSLMAEQKVSDVIDVFRYGSPIACVRDRFNFPLGIITLEDVLEEIVGDILDEYDLEQGER